MVDEPVPDISAVVCTRNRGDRVAATIASILACDHPSFELVVIDQSPEDDTARAVAAFTHDRRVRYVRSTTVGLGRARNIGLDEARAPIIAFTDDDVTVSENWLTAMADAFRRHPRVAVAFCNVAAAPHDPSAGFVPHYLRTGEHETSTVIGKCRARGIGAGLGVRRSDLIRMGGFDPELGPGGRFSSCEDGDAALRALLFGRNVLETDRTEVVHDGFRTWAEGRELTRRDWYGIGAAYSKPIKAGRFGAIPVVLFEGIWKATFVPLGALARLRRPTGLKQGWYFWRGFVAGLSAPIRRDTLVFDDRS